MSGYDNHNFDQFNMWADHLRSKGYQVSNPADVGAAEPGKTWADYLRHDIKLVADADMIATLEGWQNSRGAVLEVHIAHALGMPVLPVHKIEAKR